MNEFIEFTSCYLHFHLVHYLLELGERLIKQFMWLTKYAVLAWLTKYGFKV